MIKSVDINVRRHNVEKHIGPVESQEARLKKQLNSGFSLIEMLVAIVIFGMIAIGIRNMMLRAQENNVRESLRKTHAEMSQEITRRLNHYFKRHTTQTVTGPHRLVMTLPSGQVVVETVCVKNELSYQAPGTLLNRCVKCGSTERPVIQIRDLGTTHVFPGREQKPDRPAAASVCFKNGTDPSEVEMIVEILVVDPIAKSEKKVSKFESFLIKDSSKFTSFE